MKRINLRGIVSVIVDRIFVVKPSHPLTLPAQIHRINHPTTGIFVIPWPSTSVLLLAIGAPFLCTDPLTDFVIGKVSCKYPPLLVHTILPASMIHPPTFLRTNPLAGLAFGKVSCKDPPLSVHVTLPALMIHPPTLPTALRSPSQ